MLKSQKKHYWVAVLNSAVAVAIVSGGIALLPTILGDRSTVVEDWAALRTHQVFQTIESRRDIFAAYECPSGDTISTQIMRDLEDAHVDALESYLRELLEQMELRSFQGEEWRIQVRVGLRQYHADLIRRVRAIPGLPTRVLAWRTSRQLQIVITDTQSLEDIPTNGLSTFALTRAWLNITDTFMRERVGHDGSWWCFRIDSIMLGEAA